LPAGPVLRPARGGYPGQTGCLLCQSGGAVQTYAAAVLAVRSFRAVRGNEVGFSVSIELGQRWADNARIRIGVNGLVEERGARFVSRILALEQARAEDAPSVPELGADLAARRRR
jgi:hypothetical protein